jgi:hypothetical protein
VEEVWEGEMVLQQADAALDGFDADATPICYVNGKRFQLPQGRGEGTLLQFLRGKLMGLYFHALSAMLLIACKPSGSELLWVSASYRCVVAGLC